jgi:hypothetical protein
VYQTRSCNALPFLTITFGRRAPISGSTFKSWIQPLATLSRNGQETTTKALFCGALSEAQRSDSLNLRRRKADIPQGVSINFQILMQGKVAFTSPSRTVLANPDTSCFNENHGMLTDDYHSLYDNMVANLQAGSSLPPAARRPTTPNAAPPRQTAATPVQPVTITQQQVIPARPVTQATTQTVVSQRTLTVIKNGATILSTQRSTSLYVDCFSLKRN